MFNMSDNILIVAKYEATKIITSSVIFISILFLLVTYYFATLI